MLLITKTFCRPVKIKLKVATFAIWFQSFSVFFVLSENEFKYFDVEKQVWGTCLGNFSHYIDYRARSTTTIMCSIKAQVFQSNRWDVLVIFWKSMEEYNLADTNSFLLRSWLPLFMEYDTNAKRPLPRRWKWLIYSKLVVYSNVWLLLCIFMR